MVQTLEFLNNKIIIIKIISTRFVRWDILTVCTSDPLNWKSRGVAAVFFIHSDACNIEISDLQPNTCFSVFQKQMGSFVRIFHGAFKRENNSQVRFLWRLKPCNIGQASSCCTSDFSYPHGAQQYKSICLSLYLSLNLSIYPV